MSSEPRVDVKGGARERRFGVIGMARANAHHSPSQPITSSAIVITSKLQKRTAIYCLLKAARMVSRPAFCFSKIQHSFSCRCSSLLLRGCTCYQRHADALGGLVPRHQHQGLAAGASLQELIDLLQAAAECFLHHQPPSRPPCVPRVPAQECLSS